MQVEWYSILLFLYTTNRGTVTPLRPRSTHSSFLCPCLHPIHARARTPRLQSRHDATAGLLFCVRVLRVTTPPVSWSFYEGASNHLHQRLLPQH